jgi:thymidylate synthase
MIKRVSSTLRQTGSETFPRQIDQIGEAIKRLKNCSESRRAISVTWDPPPTPKRMKSS